MTTVQVLLATYNGGAYLAQQLDSIFAQQGVSLSVLVRDDGSTDNTLAIIDDYSRRYPGQLRLLRDEVAPAGAAANFLRLLAAEPAADYAAFCDQDDCWLPDRLQVAVSALQQVEAGIPALYFSGYLIGNDQLEPVGRSLLFLRPPGFGNALVQNIVIGATTVINRRLWDCLREPGLDARRMIMHDWWAYLLASAFGRVIYDPEPRIIYRQHAANVVGTGQGLAKRWRRLSGFFSGADRGRVTRQALYFRERHGGQLTAEQLGLLDDLYGPGFGLGALRRLLARQVYGMRGRDDLILALRLSLHRH